MYIKTPTTAQSFTGGGAAHLAFSFLEIEECYMYGFAYELLFIGCLKQYLISLNKN